MTVTNYHTSNHRNALAILSLSFFATYFLWVHLDANPLLFLYDAYLTALFSVGADSLAIPPDGDESVSGSASVSGSGSGVFRRSFPPGSTPLEGKTIWITGASSGIGAELAMQLASAGVGHLILSGRREEKLELVSRSCRKLARMRRSTVSETKNTKNAESPSHFDGHSLKISVVPFDMAGGYDVLDSAVSSALNSAGPSGIDMLILNAGQYQVGPALDLDPSQLDTSISHLTRINVIAPIQLSQRLIYQDKWKERAMNEERKSHLVVVSSLMGRGASPLNAIYSSTKHALRGYFHSLASEERSWLRVDVVCPGAVDTGLWSGSWNSVGANPKEVISTPLNSRGEAELTTSSSSALYADDRAKMKVHRCAQLIVSSIIGPNALFFESWITRNPGLIWVYLASYEPMTFHLATNVIAPMRMELWRKHGEDALYLPTLLQCWLQSMWDSFSLVKKEQSITDKEL